MKNVQNWLPTKFVYQNNKLRGSRDPKQVNIGSRIIVDVVASFYDENLRLHAQGKLVDLGCGNVPLYNSYKEYVNEIYCVDWANSFHENQFLDLVQDLNEPLKIENTSFDTIILSDVLEHIRKPESLIKEMFRILQPNGKIILNVPFFYWLHEEPFDYFRYTRHGLKAMFEDAGFELVYLEPHGGILEITGDMISKFFIVFSFGGKFLSGLTNKVFGFLMFFPLFRKITKATSNKFPLCYGMVVRRK